MDKHEIELCVYFLKLVDRGFYLFEESKLPKNAKKPTIQDDKSARIEEEEEELWEGGRNTPVHIVIVSLWFWWREVVFISLLTAFVFHMIITRQVSMTPCKFHIFTLVFF